MRASQRVFALCALAVLFSVAKATFAQDAKVVKKVEDMNRAAMEDYDLLEFESAKKQLNEALVLIKKNQLDKHPVAGRTHLNLGIVYGGGLGDPDTALLEFIAGLEIDPTLTLDPAYKTPELQKLYDQAKSTVGGARSGGKGAGASASETAGEGAEEVTGLSHVPIDEAAAGKPIQVKVKVGADVGAKQVVLYFRPQGEESFHPLVMRHLGGPEYAAQIPAAATRGDSVHYYVEAKNASGKAVASSGNAGSPNIVMLVGGSAAGGGTDFGDDENPLGGGGGGDGGDEDGGDGDEETTLRGGAAPEKRKVFFGVAVGTGGGYVTGKTETPSIEAPVKCCVAPAPFHVMPEVGFWLGDRLLLSVYGRIGFVLGANTMGHASAAPAGLARLTYALGRPGGGVAVHGDVGFGLIRRTIRLEDRDTMNVDTAAMGPLLFGGGAAWTKDLGGPLRFFADANVLLGVAVVEEIANSKPSFGINADLNLGVMFAF